MKKVSPGYLILIAIATAACGIIPDIPPLYLWIALLIITCLFFALLGGVICGRAEGVLIDGRNRMSLSRLQITLWTIVVVSAMMAAAFSNLHTHIPALLMSAHYVVSPMLLQLPQEIWLALGISATSLAATPLILSGKSQQDPNQSQLGLLNNQMSDDEQSATGTSGQVVVKMDVKAASFADLFRGDEVGNAASVDLSKVQMFYFTLILIIGYAFSIGKMFLAPATASIGGVLVYGFNAFPALSSSAVALLGISHAGYLGYKAAPHSAQSDGTVTTPDNSTQAPKAQANAAMPAPTPEPTPSPKQ
jgi:hypothetical protein